MFTIDDILDCKKAASNLYQPKASLVVRQLSDMSLELINVLENILSGGENAFLTAKVVLADIYKNNEEKQKLYASNYKIRRDWEVE